MIATMGHSRFLALLLVSVLVLMAPVPAPSQAPAPAPAPPPGPPAGTTTAFTPEQLEQIAAPIALYPDPLVAQVMMASTYPLEVVQAARFLKDNPNLQGDQLNEKLKEQTWDDSVKSLVSFPEVLTLMDQKLEWVQKLGDAFLAQQKELMDAIQRLRARAHAQGNLKTTPQQTVTVEPAAAAPATAAPPAPAAPGQPPPPQTVVVQQQPPTVITIQPANPQVIYVPSYNPTVVYGAWPYPAYPPYYPYPPGYVFGTAALSFGLGMAVGAAVWGDCDWNNGHADVNVNNYNSYSNSVNNSNVANERVSHFQQGQADRQGQRDDRQGQRQGQRDDRQGQRGDRAEWKHNPENRRGVQYRDQATQQRYNRAGNPQATQSREAFRGRAEQGRQDLARGGASSFGGGAQAGTRPQGPGGAQAGARPQGPGGAQAGARPQGPGGAQVGARPQAPGGGQFGGREAGAFQGVGAGGDARSFSSRGQASRQSSIGASRSGGGGRSTGASGGRSGGGGGRSGGGGGGRGGGGRR